MFELAFYIAVWLFAIPIGCLLLLAMLPAPSIVEGGAMCQSLDRLFDGQPYVPRQAEPPYVPRDYTESERFAAHLAACNYDWEAAERRYVAGGHDDR